MSRRRSATAAVCRPCRRALRWHRRDHHCYRAVMGEDRDDRTTWVSCSCECQRTLWSLGFFQGDSAPPAEVVPERHKQDAANKDPDAP